MPPLTLMAVFMRRKLRSQVKLNEAESLLQQLKATQKADARRKIAAEPSATGMSPDPKSHGPQHDLCSPRP
ncbi:hypothetical protein CU669_11565 [Paramagnetospirillum kuznetsovii]|uniref:Uncharacterized protein n=1 Tax=Paramagnetospirillum kuznetsovii TaxID=2053833 RepID=A0A364NYE5_9PROT|nr:hypothetical protein CU669_11565 [Paramagnetospirillum kuznetsovii]